ncbi:hypothetical protein GALL_363020 [mine drainage metagenome]|uniref:DUF3093 domain-containing protein n=1 Tax=mine drainage metagenome TaxID=410659 RepID=A0A1J5QEP4_9ZZZZ
MHTPSSLDSSASFAERLWPGPSGWLIVLATPVVSGIALLPVGTVPAIVAVVAALAIAIVVAVTTSPHVQVVDDELRAGAAHIPLRLLGAVTVLDRPGVRHAMGPELDARAYVCLRSWVDGAVRVEVVDPEDPTPYWIVSSRWPDALAEAIGHDDERPTTGA